MVGNNNSATILEGGYIPRRMCEDVVWGMRYAFGRKHMRISTIALCVTMASEAKPDSYECETKISVGDRGCEGKLRAIKPIHVNAGGNQARMNMRYGAGCGGIAYEKCVMNR